MGLQHFICKVHCAEACCLRTNEGSAEVEALAGENARVLIAETLVLAIQETYFPCPYSDIPCGNVGIGSDVLLKLGHE